MGEDVFDGACESIHHVSVSRATDAKRKFLNNL